MGDNRAAPGKVLRYLLTGAVVGSLMTCVDGAILGAIFGSDGAGPVEAALLWAGYFAAAGAVLGAIVGAVSWVFGPRMVLQPPSENREQRTENRK
jgi:hypothetical protein